MVSFWVSCCVHRGSLLSSAASLLPFVNSNMRGLVCVFLALGAGMSGCVSGICTILWLRFGWPYRLSLVSVTCRSPLPLAHSALLGDTAGLAPLTPVAAIGLSVVSSPSVWREALVVLSVHPLSGSWVSFVLVLVVFPLRGSMFDCHRRY